jgi:hypothetical protein
MERYLNARYVHRDIRSLWLSPSPVDPSSDPFPCPAAASPAEPSPTAAGDSEAPGQPAIPDRPADRGSPVASALVVAGGAVLLGVVLGLSVLLLIAHLS